MTQLSKLAILGIARETTPNPEIPPTPTAFIPFTKCDYEDIYAPIKDQSYRGNDSGLQGLYQGPAEADWSLDVMAYADLTGYFLRGMIGPDSVAPGVTTTLSASSSIGATALTVAAAIPMGSTIQIGSGAALEYATVTAATGTALTVEGQTGAGLLHAHASADPVVSQSVHTFKQSSKSVDRTSFTFTIYDTLQTSTYSGLAFSDLDIKIDPKNAVSLAIKAKSFQAVVSDPMDSPAFTAVAPVLGWQWTMANAGTTTTRGLTYDMKVKRKLDVIHSSNGVQKAREIFQGALDVEGTYKAIYENQTDFNLFLQYVQTPTTATLTQPLSVGGSVLTLTTSKSGYSKGKRTWQDYVESQFTIEGIYNGTDGGILSATLSNFSAASYGDAAA